MIHWTITRASLNSVETPKEGDEGNEGDLKNRGKIYLNGEQVKIFRSGPQCSLAFVHTP